MNSCCCKLICIGCEYANYLRERREGLEHKCPFCREPMARSQEECTENEERRARSNDPAALYQVGSKCYDRREYDRALEYYTKAAELGNAESHFSLSHRYREGKGVEKDKKKEVYHLEEAAIGGHPYARHNLGIHEENNNRFDRAANHFIIAAKLGYDDALDAVKKYFAHGFVSKEDFEAALRGHQTAVDETKSAKREEAYTFSTATNRN